MNDATPYQLLASAGITPSSSHEEILDSALDMQALGTFTPTMREAWDILRSPPERLAIDFFLVQLDPDPNWERISHDLSKRPSPNPST